MVNTEIRLIIFIAVKDGEALYSKQKQDWELTVVQIMNSLLPNSDLFEEGMENHLKKARATHSGTLAWKIPWTEESSR